MNLVLESMVVVRAPSRRLAKVPTAPSVSANAMMAPPCSTSPVVQRSGRTSSVATTLSAPASTSVIPSVPGNSGASSACMASRSDTRDHPFALGAARAATWRRRITPAGSVGDAHARSTHLAREILELGHAVLERQHRLLIVHVDAGLEVELGNHRRIDVGEAHAGVLGENVSTAGLAP